MAKEFIVAKEKFEELVSGKKAFEYQSAFNDYINDTILETIKDPQFKDIKVFALGSFGLFKLCPYSDIDLLAIGSKDKVTQLSKSLSSKLHHLKIRHIDDEGHLSGEVNYDLWIKDINVFDHYSLLFGRAFDSEDQPIMQKFWDEVQRPEVIKNKESFLSTILDEKKSRSQRFGNVAGLLQPNIKYGRGGLRDITQALGGLTWWGGVDKVLQSEVKQRLLSAYDILSQLRFAVHLLHENDYISADMWGEVMPYFSDSQDSLSLQKHVHKTFNEIKIANEYVFALEQSVLLGQSVFANEVEISKVLKKIKTSDFYFEDILYLRWHLQKVGFEFEDKIKVMEVLHEKFLQILTSKNCAQLFDSYIIPALLPHWQTIEGRPQSGHYHQYTVDQHLLKTLSAVCEIQSGDVNMFKLAPFVSGLRETDWQMLKWVSLFHDLAKGLPGDHSEVGARIVNDEISCEGWSEKFKQEIYELVAHHLLLSKAAFRYDHNDAENLQSLYTKLKSYRFFKILTVFTAADILASNPEAWNEWKADQFFLLSESFQAFVNNGQVNALVHIEGFEVLASLAKKLSDALLRADILSLPKGPATLDVKVIEHEHNLWIRAYDQDSGPGVLAKMLNLFFQAGISIEQAFICGSQDKKSAYNWFRLPLKTSKTAVGIQKTLTTLKSVELTDAPLSIRFESIKCLSAIEGKWVFLFKGLDQKGLLLKVTQIFSSLKLNILKAQVSTWGDSVEDVFVVEQNADLSLDEVLEHLKRELIDNYWH